MDTLYGNPSNPFPASISFTGLAWHALISVGIGWYWQAKVLTAGNPGKIALFCRSRTGLGPVGRVVASRAWQSQYVTNRFR